MKKRIKLPFIWVRWKDHCWIGGNREVVDLNSIKRAKPYFIEEVGWLISEDKEKIVFCKTINEGFNGKIKDIDYVDATIILKSDIEKMKFLTPQNLQSKNSVGVKVDNFYLN